MSSFFYESLSLSLSRHGFDVTVMCAGASAFGLLIFFFSHFLSRASFPEIKQFSGDSSTNHSLLTVVCCAHSYTAKKSVGSYCSDVAIDTFLFIAHARRGEKTSTSGYFVGYSSISTRTHGWQTRKATDIDGIDTATFVETLGKNASIVSDTYFSEIALLKSTTHFSESGKTIFDLIRRCSRCS